MSTVIPSAPALSVFHFDSTDIRIVERDGEVWFVASDVCAALHVSNATQAVARLDEDERAMFNIGRQGEVNIVSESGLYSLVLGSRKAEAKRFKRWVTHEVLPAIRRTGRYVAPSLQEEGIDVAELLLSGQSALTVPLPLDVQKAVDRRAGELAGEVYCLIREHLHRRISYSCVAGYPERSLNISAALTVVEEGGLGFALAHKYHAELQKCEQFLRVAQSTIGSAMSEIRERRRKV